jgi:hypothetical protein
MIVVWRSPSHNTLSLGTQMRFRFPVAPFVIALSISCSRGTADTPNWESQAIVSHDEVYTRVIVPDHRGGYIIAGASAEIRPNFDNYEGWAIRVDGVGDTKWWFKATKISTPPAAGLGFSGAMVLADDSVLFCGTGLRDTATKGLLAHVTADGKFIDERLSRPEEDTPLSVNTGFATCIPWGDGFAVLGFVERDGWLVKLDRNGKFEWQLRGSAYSGEEAMEMANHDLVIVTNLNPLYGTTIRRLNPQGKVVASYSDTGSGHLIHPLAATTNLRVYVIDENNGHTRYLTLDGNLKRVADTAAEQFYTKKAYEKPDGSLILFGGTWGPESTSAVGIRDTHGRMVRYALTPRFQSNWIDDAVPTGRPNEFVVIRTLLSFYPGSVGWPKPPPAAELFIHRPVVAWVTIAPTAAP